MIIADTSALISLTTVDLLDTLLAEFDIQTTETVLEELENRAEYDDVHGDAARTIVNHSNQLTVHRMENGEFQSSRVDPGEGSCALLAKELDAEFLITDDLRALPELETVADANIAISPIVLKALVTRGVLEKDDAREKVEQLAENRDWLGSPIYRRAQKLFE